MLGNYEEIEEKHKDLIEKAIKKMNLVKDPKHSLSHVLQVVEYTKEILENVNADSEVCIISAYWHDVGRIEKNKGHALISANLLKEEMRRLAYDENFIDKCYKAIYKHSWNEKPETLEGDIIRDADKIDFVGIDRWKKAVEMKKRFTKIIENMPILRNDILQLQISKKIYDREIVQLVKYLHDVTFDNM